MKLARLAAVTNESMGAGYIIAVAVQAVVHAVSYTSWVLCVRVCANEGRDMSTEIYCNRSLWTMPSSGHPAPQIADKN